MVKFELCKHCLNNGEEKESVLAQLKTFKQIFAENNSELVIEETGCLGSCKGIVGRVNGEVYTELSAEKVKEILDGLL